MEVIEIDSTNRDFPVEEENKENIKQQNLKDLENQIAFCEQALKDENDKRNMYKVVVSLKCNLHIILILNISLYIFCRLMIVGELIIMMALYAHFCLC